MNYSCSLRRHFMNKVKDTILLKKTIKAYISYIDSLNSSYTNKEEIELNSILNDKYEEIEKLISSNYTYIKDDNKRNLLNSSLKNNGIYLQDLIKTLNEKSESITENHSILKKTLDDLVLEVKYIIYSLTKSTNFYEARYYPTKDNKDDFKFKEFASKKALHLYYESHKKDKDKFNWCLTYRDECNKIIKYIDINDTDYDEEEFYDKYDDGSYIYNLFGNENMDEFYDGKDLLKILEMAERGDIK